MKKLLQFALVLSGIAGLIAVRMFQEDLFYDPFLHYFLEADRKAAFPEFEWTKLILHHIFRFLLNLFFAALIIYGFFLNRKWTLQGILLISIVFAVTLPAYLYCIQTKFDIGYLFSFYVRRFVIQPLILLLIIPMFYYRKYMLEDRTL